MIVFIGICIVSDFIDLELKPYYRIVGPRDCQNVCVVRDFSDFKFKFHVLVEGMCTIKNFADLSCKDFKIEVVEFGGLI